MHHIIRGYNEEKDNQLALLVFLSTMKWNLTCAPLILKIRGKTQTIQPKPLLHVLTQRNSYNGPVYGHLSPPETAYSVVLRDRE